MADDSEKIPTGEERNKLFREWEADYAARREEDRREREGVSSPGPRETWPSEIAKANRNQPQQAPGHGKSDAKEHSHDDGYSM